MGVEAIAKRWYHKPWVTLSGGILIGLLFAAMIVGISGAQLWASFKGRYFSKKAA